MRLPNQATRNAINQAQRRKNLESFDFRIGLGKEDALALTIAECGELRSDGSFERDFKRQKRRGKDIEDLFAAVELLAETGSLPTTYRPHQLSGEWKGVWECHIEADWLLLFEVTRAEVILIRTGTHADLFE